MNFFKKRKIALCSPLGGEVIPLSEVPDPVFAQEMLGKGFAIVPTDGKVYSPINGKIVTIFETKHALGLEGENGIEVLVHVGIDTVKMNGEPFLLHVKKDDVVQVGQLLSEVDFQKIENAGHSTITPIIVTNTQDFKSVNLLKSGQVDVGEEILQIIK